MSKSYACFYATLSNYNTSVSAKNQTLGEAGTPNQSIQVLPVYGAPSYEALTHEGKCNCGGHFTISDAYPQVCTPFSKVNCNQ